MATLTKRQRDLLALIKRSTPEPDGWYEVSDVVWPLVEREALPDLIETEPRGDGGRLRLTARGQAVSDYL